MPILPQEYRAAEYHGAQCVGQRRRSALRGVALVDTSCGFAISAPALSPHRETYDRSFADVAPLRAGCDETSPCALPGCSFARIGQEGKARVASGVHRAGLRAAFEIRRCVFGASSCPWRPYRPFRVAWAR